MECNGILKVDNPTHMWALQYVYLPRINKALTSFVGSWNLHPLSSEGNKSPMQLWITGQYFNDDAFENLVSMLHCAPPT